MSEFYLAMLTKRAFTTAPHAMLPGWGAVCDAPHFNWTSAPDGLLDDAVDTLKYTYKGQPVSVHAGVGLAFLFLFFFPVLREGSRVCSAPYLSQDIFALGGILTAYERKRGIKTAVKRARLMACLRPVIWS